MGVDPTRSISQRDSLLIEKNRVYFQVLENPSPVRNGFFWSHHLLFIFIFIFLNGENEVKTKKPLIDFSQEKAVHKNWISGSWDQVTCWDGTSCEVAPL